MKQSNEYAKLIPHFDDIPKTVLAAIAVSLAVRLTGEEDFDGAIDDIITEWHILHSGGIVPQPVPKQLRGFVELG